MAKKEMSFFHEGTLHICGSLDIDEGMKGCREFLKKHMPVNGIMLCTYDPDIKSVIMLSNVLETKKIITDTPVPVGKEAQEYIEGRQDKIVFIRHPNDTPISKEMSRHLGIGRMSGMVMQLEDQGKRLGVVIVLAAPPKHFTDNHRRLLELLEVPFTIAMSNTLRYREIRRLEGMLRDDNRFLSNELHRISGEKIIGEKGGLKKVMEMVRLVSPLNSHVLLLGESGVGKEVIANALHYSSQRRTGPFIKINCGAIPETLLDTELFGHEKGAYTGATDRRRGRFERAHGGTIFLDEIGELPPAAQVRLLRVLQSRKIERVGGREPLPVDVRVISATHRDLKAMVNAGGFREDLWYRLNVFPIMIPPLRQRKEDIPALAEYFMNRKTKEMKLQMLPAIAPGALSRLSRYDWPGNVRELENMVERELIQSQARGPEAPLCFDELGTFPVTRKSPPSTGIQASSEKPIRLDSIIRSHIQHVLALTNGKVQGADGAAALLGVHPSTLRYRMKKLAIPFGRDA